MRSQFTSSSKRFGSGHSPRRPTTQKIAAITMRKPIRPVIVTSKITDSHLRNEGNKNKITSFSRAEKFRKQQTEHRCA